MNRSLRAFTPVLLLATLSGACASTGIFSSGEPPPPPAASEVDEPPGIRPSEEAVVLRLEDRREFQSRVAAEWLASTNPLLRARMALALGRIGTATFDDENGNGQMDDGELRAGVRLLGTLTTDSSFVVRRQAAFALGEIGDPTGLDPLWTLASDEHADVAAEAVEALSKIAPAVSLQRYAQLLQSDSREAVRARAVRYLFRFGTDEASELAASLLGNASEMIRREAAYALSRRAHAPSRTRLELLLTDGDTLTRAYAARALGRIGDPASLERLLARTTDPEPWVRTEVARAIAAIAAGSPESLQNDRTERTLRVIALTEDPDPGTRSVAVDLLGAFLDVDPAAKTKMLRIARDGSRWERERAAAAIASRMPSEHEILSALLEGADRGVERAVLEATSGTAAGVEIRRRFAADPDPSVRAAAVGAIPDEPAEVEIGLIRAALDDVDVVVRANAIDRFAARKDVVPDELLPVLLAAERRGRDDAMNDARISAISAIAGFDASRLSAETRSNLENAQAFHDVESFLRRLLDDSDLVVRRIASDAIADTLKLPRPQYTPLPVDRPLQEYEAVAIWAAARHTATIHLPRGNIEVLLLTQEAPMTAKNFADLAERGFYDDTSFMRVVPDFVIQGGDPRNDMNGGPGYAIRDEINLQKYTRGAVGMALSGPDTGGSQFFITHSPQHHLDGGYTIFGRVIEGMNEVVDQTERGDSVSTIRIDERAAPSLR